MKISIIVPVYNAECYLRRCLDSIVNQTFSNLEIILINDGSTDSSGIICDEYSFIDDRIIVIHQRNQGQSNARNKGLDIATGDYIGFVDADDFVDRRMYEILSSTIKDNDIAVCNYNLVYPNKEIKDSTNEVISYKILSINEIWEEVFYRLNNAVWNKLFKKNLIGDIRFKNNLYHGEDMFFIMEYISKCKIGITLNKPLYFYCKNSSSVTNSKFSERKITEVISRDLMLDYIVKNKPLYKKYALLLCFRSRMNVIRQIYNYNQALNYNNLIKNYKEEVKEYFLEIGNLLNIKEKIEYFCFEHVFFIYLLTVKLYIRIKRSKL